MKLFKTSQGFVIAFGFDMIARKPDPHRISWCDPTNGEWECNSTNLAGWHATIFEVAPEFVRECRHHVIAYQPGLCIEMQQIGAPLVWSVRPLLADQANAIAA